MANAIEPEFHISRAAADIMTGSPWPPDSGSAVRLFQPPSIHA